MVQSREQMNLGAGLGVAVREFATASGPVDYALFVGRTLCGVVEAKPEGTTLSGFSDQAARYMGSVPDQLVRRDGQVRFEYVASGQHAWLFAIRDFIAVNVDITPEDLMDAPDFAAQGGLLRAHALFGDRLRPILDELPQVLIA